MSTAPESKRHSEPRLATRDSETGELLVVDDDGLWRRPVTDSEDLLGCEVERLYEQFEATERERADFEDALREIVKLGWYSDASQSVQDRLVHIARAALGVSNPASSPKEDARD